MRRFRRRWRRLRTTPACSRARASGSTALILRDWFSNSKLARKRRYSCCRQWGPTGTDWSLISHRWVPTIPLPRFSLSSLSVKLSLRKRRRRLQRVTLRCREYRVPRLQRRLRRGHHRPLLAYDHPWPTGPLPRRPSRLDPRRHRQSTLSRSSSCSIPVTAAKTLAQLGLRARMKRMSCWP